MPTGDTSPEIYQRQLEIYRRMTPLQRLKAGLELSEISRALLERGVDREHPDYSATQKREEVSRRWLRPFPPSKP